MHTCLIYIYIYISLPPSQLCPDQNVYATGITDYTTASPIDESTCPNVKYPPIKAKDVCPRA